MKEYLIKFEKHSIRKLLTNNDFIKFQSYIGKTDKNGIKLISIEQI